MHIAHMPTNLNQFDTRDTISNAMDSAAVLSERVDILAGHWGAIRRQDWAVSAQRARHHPQEPGLSSIMAMTGARKVNRQI